MKKISIILLLAFVFLNGLSSIENLYKKIRIPQADKATISRLQRMGLCLEGLAGKTGEYLDLIIDDRDLHKLNDNNISYKIIVEDMASFYQSRFGISNQELNRQRERFDTPENFNFGSMGGYLTFDEVVAELDSMCQLYPQIITEKTSIGTSTEDRDIWVVKISDNPNVTEDEPQAFFNALHHAREPEGMMTVIYTMWHLLENYGIDEEITQLIDSREIYFVPVINPDGYVYNQQTNPNGGGNWRKNKRDNNNNGSFSPSNDGVDLNRNYGYYWGYDDEGSSPDPTDITYRGPSAFSEPETSVIRQFLIEKNIKTANNYHTYSNLIIYPFGYEADAFPPEPDLTTYLDYSIEMFKDNLYSFGNPYQTIAYLTNGGAEDWMYGEQIEKQKIFVVSFEVGSPDDGFWPATDRIIPLADENLRPNIFLAQVAGSFYEILNLQMNDDFLDPGETVDITLEIQNIGLTASSGSVSMEVSTSSPYLSLNIPTIQIGDRKSVV